MPAAEKKSVSKPARVTDSATGNVTQYPSEVTVTTSGNLVVNVTGLLRTADAKRQIDALKELAELEKKK